MKKLILGVAAVVALGSTSVLAESQTKLDKSVEGTLVKICQAAADNDSRELRSLLKEHHISARTAANKVVCNNEPLTKFAVLNGAIDSATYIAKKADINLDGLLASNN